MKRLFFTMISVVALAFGAWAQPSVTKVQLIMVPNHADALYRTGEQAKVKLIALDCGMALNDVTVDYEISEDVMPAHEKKSVKLKGNEVTIPVGTMKTPGYVRVKAEVKHEGKVYTSYVTMGFDAEKLMPVVKMPEDFDAFWEESLDMLKAVELRPKMELLADRCTDKVNVYHVSYANIGGTRMYGMLTMPKAEGKYPAILRLPGAGVGEKSGDIYHAEQGVIVLELGIHGIPVNMTGSVYSDLAKGALANYNSINNEDKYNYYYRRVYLGCVKGVDFLLSLPECSGKIGTLGGSQGGALSIVTSRLDSRVAATAIYFPALSDQEGYIAGRAGCWPHVFKNKENRTKERVETLRYYDAANFARGLKAPVYFAYGYNDLTCPPTATRATYNAIAAPKTLNIGENIGHWLYPEQNSAMWKWIIDELKK